MARIYTAKIQERDGVETYTAQIQKNGAGVDWKDTRNPRSKL